MSDEQSKPSVKQELITREEAAMRLGFSIPELRRRERLGQIKYAKKGAHNTYLYNANDVKALADLIGRVRGQYTPAEAAAVFKLLKEGRSNIDCVIEAGVDPVAVEAIAEQYGILSKGFYVSAEVMKRINSMPIDGPLPIVSENDLIEFIGAIGGAKCLECDKKPRAFCQGCVREALKKARNEGKEKAAGTDEL